MSESDLLNLIMEVYADIKSGYQLDHSDIIIATSSIQHQLSERDWLHKNLISGVGYDDLAKCCAYLRRYAVCHAALARYSALEIFRNIPPANVNYLINCERLRITSVGGGPGNDLIGFCSAMENMFGPKLNESVSEFYLSAVDISHHWESIFTKVMYQAAHGNFGKIGRLFLNKYLEYHFIQADLTFEKKDNIREADVILMVKVLSNVSAVRKEFILENVFSSMKEDAIFIYIDIDKDSVIQFANKPKHNMTVLYQCDKRLFEISISVPRTMLSSSTYAICVLQKIKE